MEPINLNWGGNGFKPYAVECKSKKSDTETIGQADTAADRATRDRYSTEADKRASAAVDDPTSTGLYKSLYTTGIQATNHAYDDAKAATKLHARVAGFGYEQPLSQAADEGVENERAGELSNVPREAALSAVAPELQVANMEAGIGGNYGNQATSYFSTAGKAEEARMAARAALMSSLIGAGAKIGSMFIPKIPGMGGK